MAVQSDLSVPERHAIARDLLSSGNTTIFSNGWAQGWGWWASGARNISEVPGVGVNHKSGSSSGTSAASSTIPKGLQMIIQDSTGQVTCSMPLGSAYSTNNKLAQSMTLIPHSPSNSGHQDCQTALQSAHAIGLRSLWDNVSFCIDDIQLLSSTVVSQGTLLGILLGVAGPAAGVAAWLAITYTYRRSKRRLVLQVRKRFQLKHISYDKDAHSVSANQHSSSAMVQMPTVTSPLIAKQLPGSQTDSVMTPFDDELTSSIQASEVPSNTMRRAAVQIAQQCLRCWDRTLGICPATDAGGAKAGIWGQKFDGVRCAALLLAFQKLNRHLQMQPGRPDTLMQAWTQSTTARQRQEVVSAVAQTLQTISQAEAQALPDKDPDVAAIAYTVNIQVVSMCGRESGAE
ncbi:MAG: hypothetical protein FRX49_11736 [Trebouxia sp. A1-2]|nr:MAG: hypothetical protein FRX49_11736 [Trebouxia sp. A1-2]